jgi:hypothetical protein
MASCVLAGRKESLRRRELIRVAGNIDAGQKPLPGGNDIFPAPGVTISHEAARLGNPDRRRPDGRVRQDFVTALSVDSASLTVLPAPEIPARDRSRTGSGRRDQRLLPGPPAHVPQSPSSANGVGIAGHPQRSLSGAASAQALCLRLLVGCHALYNHRKGPHRAPS